MEGGRQTEVVRILCAVCVANAGPKRRTMVTSGCSM